MISVFSMTSQTATCRFQQTPEIPSDFRQSHVTYTCYLNFQSRIVHIFLELLQLVLRNVECRSLRWRLGRKLEYERLIEGYHFMVWIPRGVSRWGEVFASDPLLYLNRRQKLLKIMLSEKKCLHVVT